MAKIFERSSTRLTISEFYDNLKKYNFNVSYQRKSNVWSEDKQSFLIDSIFKNYPIPAIFMRPKVDTDTGKTVYDIVDGKQRLEAIIAFIRNEVPLTSYFDEDDFFLRDDDIKVNLISGQYFDFIKASPDFADYVKQFWTYGLNIEYLYEENETFIASVFDRLNRNGEPLTRQELRNAKYNTSPLSEVIKSLNDSGMFWINKQNKIKSVRMEDEEFMSELFFMVLKNKILDSSPDLLDSLYDEYSKEKMEYFTESQEQFHKIVKFVKELQLPFVNYKRLNWSTHLYAIFSFAWYCINNNINSTDVKENINKMYNEYMSKGSKYEGVLKDYKDSSSSATKSELQRKRRLDAILKYCNCTINKY